MGGWTGDGSSRPRVLMCVCLQGEICGRLGGWVTEEASHVCRRLPLLASRSVCSPIRQPPVFWSSCRYQGDHRCAFLRAEADVVSFCRRLLHSPPKSRVELATAQGLSAGQEGAFWWWGRAGRDKARWAGRCGAAREGRLGPGGLDAGAGQDKVRWDGAGWGRTGNDGARWAQVLGWGLGREG